jgi:hypothetical protein
MEDTSPEIKAKYRQMIMSRTGEERIGMCAEMFDSARAVIVASLPTDLSPVEFRKQLFERTYGCPAEAVEKLKAKFNCYND